jgi:N-acetylneuraminic acid mutarotase
MRGTRRWLTFAVLASACREPTEITFAVTTDVPCARVTGTAIAVGSLGDFDTRPFAATSTACSATGSLGSLVVVPGAASDVAVRIVTGLDGKTPEQCAQSGYTGGCIVARRALGFTKASPLVASVAMEASCRDVVCSPDTSCSKGACVSLSSACSGASCAVAPAAPPSQWKPMAPGSQAGVKARSRFSAVWSGTELLVFGGQLTQSSANASDGGRYDPRANSWRYIPNSPLQARNDHAAVWTGSEMLVWGGNPSFADGARYSPTTNTWATIAPPPAELSGRFRAGAVWATTTREMIVWGGVTWPAGTEWDDGAAYSPEKNTWRRIARSPLGARDGLAAVWLGDKALFYGGKCCAGSNTDGAFYDPSSDTWSPVFGSPLGPRRFHTAAWSRDPGDPIAFYGGGGWSSDAFSEGALLRLRDQQFELTPPASPLSLPARSDGGGWMSSRKLWVWGGDSSPAGGVTGDGASYDLDTKQWAAMPTAGAPSPRAQHCVVWTGNEAIVWGGVDKDGNALDDGALFTR